MNYLEDWQQGQTNKTNDEKRYQYLLRLFPLDKTALLAGQKDLAWIREVLRIPSPSGIPSTSWHN